MISRPTSRFLYGLTSFGCVSLIGVALVFQHVMGLEPCALCIMQRVMVITTGFIALIAALHNPGISGIRIYAGLSLAAIVGGGSISTRHLWLQNLPPDQVPACGPSLDYMLDVFPILDILEMLLLGDGNCAEVVWSLLGISIPGWVLLAFCGLAAITILQLLSPKTS